MKNNDLIVNEWKIEYRQDGCFFIGHPYFYNGKLCYGWVIGPLDIDVAKFIFDAINEKRKRFGTPEE